VNHDDVVDIDDVTALISRVLGSGTVCEICGDVNKDSNIDIDDVTSLINIVLGNTSNMMAKHSMPQNKLPIRF
jgi:hypothetical protein